MICHRHSPKIFELNAKTWVSCSYYHTLDSAYTRLGNFTFRLYRPNRSSFHIPAHHCSIVQSYVRYYSDILNNPFSFPNASTVDISREECSRMGTYKKCSHGTLRADLGVWRTENSLDVSYSYWKIGNQYSSAINCIYANSTLIGTPGSDTLQSPHADVPCKLPDGFCILEDGTALLWDPNPYKQAECGYVNFALWPGSVFVTERSLTLWISWDGDVALTFPPTPKRVMDCEIEYVVSDQGYAVSYSDYSKVLQEMTGTRGKREVPASGPVFSEQLAAQLTSASVSVTNQLRHVLLHLVRSDCLRENGHRDPVLLARNLAHTPYVTGKWITENSLEVWPCSPVQLVGFRKSKQCHRYLPIVARLENETLEAFIDPWSMIVRLNDALSPCHLDRFQTIKLHGEYLVVDQLSGSSKTVTPTMVSPPEYSSLGGLDTAGLPLQVYKDLVITNITDIDQAVLGLIKSYHLSSTLVHDERGPTSGQPIGSIAESSGTWNLLKGLDFEKWVTRAVTLYVIYLFVKKNVIPWILRAGLRELYNRPARAHWFRPRAPTIRHSPEPPAIELDEIQSLPSSPFNPYRLPDRT